MGKKKSPKKETTKPEEPSKPNRYALKEDLEGAEESEGEPVGVKKPKRAKGIVALKHRKVMKEIFSPKNKNNGKSRKPSMYDTLLALGYSENYARSGQIKKTKAWNLLTAERLHDDKISNIHSQLLVAKKIDYMLFTSEIEDEDIYELLESVGAVVKKIVHGVQGTHVWFWSADNKIRKDALDLAYKVLGKFAAEKVELTGGLASLSDADLAAKIKEAKDRFRKKD